MNTFNFVKAGLGLICCLALFSVPLFASKFVTLQIGVQSLYLAILGMSLAFIGGYGGMVSMAQISLAGVGSYAIAIMTVTYGQPVWLAIVVALLAATLIGLIFALVSVRTEGIYFLMITLALAMLTYFFALQNRSLTRGFSGIGGIRPPEFGVFSLQNPTNFYYVSLVLALLVFFGLTYLIRTPFGLALQGIRDNPQRMAAMGFNVTGHRIAAFTLAAFVAGISGILAIWYNGQISPGSIDLTRNMNVLLITVLGGMLYFEGAFVGALFFVVVTTFASSFTDRFNLLIGIAFLLVALFLPEGLMGMVHRIRKRIWTSSFKSPKSLIQKKIGEES